MYESVTTSTSVYKFSNEILSTSEFVPINSHESCRFPSSMPHIPNAHTRTGSGHLILIQCSRPETDFQANIRLLKALFTLFAVINSLEAVTSSPFNVGLEGMKPIRH